MYYCMYVNGEYVYYYCNWYYNSIIFFSHQVNPLNFQDFKRAQYFSHNIISYITHKHTRCTYNILKYNTCIIKNYTNYDYRPAYIAILYICMNIHTSTKVHNIIHL